jgi:hypothetical protein
MYLQKVLRKRKKIEKLICIGVLKVSDEKSRILQDPDSYQNVTNPEQSLRLFLLEKPKNIEGLGCRTLVGFTFVKGTVPRDFRLLFFFMNQFPPSP